MINTLISLLFLLLLFADVCSTHWTSSGYPDLRGPSVSSCAVQPRTGSLLYVCDPDHVLNATEGQKLNDRLHDLAVGTPCHCQRRSQCTSGDALGNPFHGFVVSVALVNNLQMTIHSPSEQQLTDRAEGFCRTLEGRWALGDCGNSVIIFVWKHYKKMVIWPARLAEKYVTVDERRHILSSVNSLVQNDQWSEALTQVVAELHRELQGEPEDRVDTGTLSLIIAVGVACLLTLLITCCVCAFRCCGNLRNEESENVRKAVRRVDSLRAQVIRRGSQLRRSISRSPKFSIREHPIDTDFFTDADTTIV
ncbi:hypothetical protein Tcan_06958 [Toxocara canis]|uniref:Uncharacterized protein n=2 Tax=Toxocara canis TaxID=6265 RepID=A0A0B2UVN8_TOXCA|nr:hypothetical protein Tcan_06958 [Toxocara canis]VDM44562.1 unnamed protein product [Toxocara canis]